MKKISRRNFLKVSGAMAAAGALAACGGSGASTPAASGAASTSTAASAAAAGEDKFASLGDFTMTVGHAQPEGNPRFVSMEQFAADVAEATNGHVKIEVYGNGQLGTEKEMLEQVVAGTVQGMRGGQFDFSPRLLMFTLPFLTNTRAQVTALLQSDLAQNRGRSWGHNRRCTCSSGAGSGRTCRSKMGAHHEAAGCTCRHPKLPTHPGS